MNQVIDTNGTSWPATVQAVSDLSVTVKMAGSNGLNAVCSGPARDGQVMDGIGNTYGVRLPGSFSGLIVTFRKT